MKLEFPQHVFEKHWNIKFHENLSSDSRAVPCGQKDGQTDMTKLIVAFRNFPNAPKNSTFCPHSVFMCFVWIWEQTAIISLYNINWLVCITETECVYCAVRTGSLKIFVCFVWISEQTAIISLYNINWLLFITDTECVYCAVRTGSLKIFVCFVWISEQTAIISLYNINWLFCITESVFTARYGLGKDIYVFCVDLRTNSHYFPIQH